VYTGYLALGGQYITDDRFEIINTDRCLAYVEAFNEVVRTGEFDPGQSCIDWIVGCDQCPGYGDVFAPGSDYTSPSHDPAPWFDPLIMDSERFLGLIGLDVQGVDDSTGKARVEQALGGGGAIGRRKYEARTMVVRCLAVAIDECGMQIGLNWLRCQRDVTVAECVGDTLWYLDCCPDCARTIYGGIGGSGPCWATTYDEVLGYPLSCPAGTWWPNTYTELLNGPPDDSQWCRWLISYTELLIGLPQFSCKTADCIVPYVRQYHACSITEGPTVLSRRTMHKVGVIAEIEFTIVAADPVEYTPDIPTTAFSTQGKVALPWSDPTPLPGPVADPFVTVNPLVRPRVETLMPMPTDWNRYTDTFTINPNGHMVDNMRPTFKLTGVGEVDEVRVTVLKDMEVVAGFAVPKVPDGATIEVVGTDKRVWTEYGGERQMRNGYARAHDGRPLQWGSVPSGDYDLVVDLAQGSAGHVVVEVLAAHAGCP